jgi:DNA-binding transcriptional MerR regulator
MNKKKAIPENFMTVGELAKKMGTTVRTLQYYDKEGLLSPTTESEGGRRLYTHKDMIKLHQILSLKSLGFSLDDIKNKLISLDTPEYVSCRRPDRICESNLYRKNPIFTKDGDNVKVKVSVKFLDNQTKATLVSQYELVLHKDSNWKIVG